MADPFDSIDAGADFERWAVGLAPVTVAQIDPDTGAVGTSVENVPATKLPRTRQPFGASGGELGGDAARFVFRANLLGFTVKPNDQITETDGTTWLVTSANLHAFDALCTADVAIQR